MNMDSRTVMEKMVRLCLYMYILYTGWMPHVWTQENLCPNRCVCFGTTVRCMFINLEKIPTVPSETTILDLRFNRIQEVPPGTFNNLKHLHTLLLNNNHIRSLQNGAFDGLPELQYLYIYKNNIEEIESDVFNGLNKLEQLYVHFNRLDHIEPGTFSQLPALERLFLHNNEIKRLPRGVFTNLSTLRRLRLDSNALICDCQLMWLSEMLKQGHTEAAAICEAPSDVQGMSLLAVSQDDLHCRRPQVTVGPSDVEVAFGNTAHFTCRAEGDPEPEITWYHNDEEIRPNTVEGSGRYNVLDDGTLMIEDTQDTDMGVYECVARNAAGETKANAVELRHARDTGRPEILTRPEDQTVTTGETVTLNCRATGRPRPIIVWLRNDLPLPNDGRFSVDSTGTLTITNIQYEDRGLFRCSARSFAGSVSDFARLEVLLGPSFVQRPQDKRVVEGHSAFFSCDATAEPAPSIRWTFNGSPFRSSPRINVNPSGTTLSIQRVSVSDTGLYTCIAEGGGGRNTASAQLTVSTRSPPTLERAPTSTTAHSNENVVFECSASGDPAPTIQWLRDGIPVLSSNKFQFSSDGSLVIHGVGRNDEGFYQCVATNAAGSARALARLRVTGPRSTVSSIDDSFLNRTVNNVINRVNTAIDNTLTDLRDPHKMRTPSDLLRLFRFPSRNALQISRAAEVFERTLEVLHREIEDGYAYNISHAEIEYRDILSPSQIAVVASLAGCTEHQRVSTCDDMCYHQRYRTFDGMCNNLKHAMWGAALTPLNRLVTPLYDNGFNLPRGWDPDKLYHGYLLPTARRVSLKLSSPTITEDEQYTHMLMQWGQFFDHDIDFVPQAISNARFSDGRFCNETCSYQPPCFPINIPHDDPRVRHRRCIGVTRSSAVCGSGMTSLFFNSVHMREQINELTSYMDASNIYGSSEEMSRNLRDFTSHRGLLRTGIIMPSGKPLLPPNNGEPVDCQMDPNTGHVPCFQAGDVRANEQLGLLSMHTLWLREHNKIATTLLEINPHWDGDTIYHETRKIVGAQLQHITYKHWLPIILGPRGMEMLGEYKGYDSSVDATIVNGFATAAFRFGHSLINPVLFRLNSTFQPIPEGNLPLHKAFFAPFRIIEEGGIDPVIRGLYGRAAKKVVPGEFLNTELTEKLFKLAHEVALDLAALNIQRGRDHGLNTYNMYRNYCGLTVAKSFEEFGREIRDSELRQKLLEIYGHPDNVDLWVGGLSEDPVEGSKLGPTFMCIIAEQFKRLRDGDRFWYENPGVFSASQRMEIEQSSLARVICDNGDDITQVQVDVFRRAAYPDGMVTCDSDSIPYIDFKQWAHCCHDCARAGDFRSITSHSRARRSVDTSYPTDDLYQNDETAPPTQPDLSKYSEDSHDNTNHGNSPDSAHHEHHNKQEHEHHEHHEHQDIQGPYDGLDLSPQGVMEEMSRMSHKLMDAVEVRIEGMEDVVITLQNNVHKLRRKIRKLEKQLKYDKTERKPKHKPSECVDKLGLTRQPKDKWKVHDCRTCQCLEGQIECTTEMCPIPDCEYPEKLPGLCCPICT